MPQPYSYKAKGSALLAFGVPSLDERPHHAILLAKVICAWAGVEGALGDLLARMIDAKQPSDFDQFDLSSFAKTTRVLSEAAKRAAKEPTHFELYQAIEQMVVSLYKRRNAVAHRIWGVASDVEDGLILVDPDEQLQFHLAFTEHLRQRSILDHTKSLYDDFTKRILVYTRADFERLIDDLTRMHGYLISLGFVLGSFPEPGRGYQKLSNEPDIREALARLRGRPKKNQEAPQ